MACMGYFQKEKKEERKEKEGWEKELERQKAAVIS
jgi:hypothetical protein